MAEGTFKCAKCDRTFSMAAHLARHKNSIHGRGKVGRPARRKARRGRPRGRVGRPRGRRTTAIRAPGDRAARVVSEMTAYLSELTARRDTLDAQIAGIQNAMTMLGRAPLAVPGAPRRGRPPGRRTRTGSLKATIVRVLRRHGKPMSPRDIATGVVRAGYRSGARNLTKAVSNALPELRELRKVGRGQYQV